VVTGYFLYDALCKCYAVPFHCHHCVNWHY
jgi:hypothetical protein